MILGNDSISFAGLDLTAHLDAVFKVCTSYMKSERKSYMSGRCYTWLSDVQEGPGSVSSWAVHSVLRIIRLRTASTIVQLNCR